MFKHLASAALAAALLLPAAALAKDSGRQAWVSSNHIQVIDLDEGKVVGKIGLQEFIHDMAFAPDGSVAYVASSKGLRVADAEQLQFTQRVDSRNTRGLVVSADGSRLLAIHKAPSDAALAARKAGLPLPASTVAVYDTGSMTVESSFPVSGNAFDLALSADGQQVYVLVPHDGSVYVYDLVGTDVETIRLVEQGPSATQHSMLSELAMSPDGKRLIVPVTDANRSWLAEIDTTKAANASDRVIQQDLGHARRIQGVNWDDDGSGLYVTAVNSMVKFGKEHSLPIAWQAFPVNFVDVQGLPASDEMVVVTPTFSSANKSGGVALLNGKGEIVRSVELPDCSPFVVVVRP